MKMLKKKQWRKKEHELFVMLRFMIITREPLSSSSSTLYQSHTSVMYVNFVSVSELWINNKSSLIDYYITIIYIYINIYTFLSIIVDTFVNGYKLIKFLYVCVCCFSISSALIVYWFWGRFGNCLKPDTSINLSWMLLSPIFYLVGVQSQFYFSKSITISGSLWAELGLVY